MPSLDGKNNPKKSFSYLRGFGKKPQNDCRLRAYTLRLLCGVFSCDAPCHDFGRLWALNNDKKGYYISSKERDRSWIE
ncbi:hypothetical protein GWI33_013437 [Rhynchophorus ferrugineus]|uniref:Uncharacterized protein n=1 Tax=Rhynchophorus ferrugineus TaxID=354439 RepID=A0A834I744_RHYFE|nr:hypothetical protein GWI33_013437 [Rhynchophorus ferrugineus]